MIFGLYQHTMRIMFSLRPSGMSKLKGALVKAHMAFCRCRIKSKNRDVFNTVLREPVILSPPAAMPSSLFKRHRLNAGPSTEQQR
jgi:hypothetical protein